MKQLSAFAVLLAALGLVIVGFILANPFDQYNPVEEAQAARIRAETEADTAWQQATQPIRIALYVCLGSLAIVGGGLALFGTFRYLERRARTIYPDGNGAMPAVILRPGEILADLGALAGPARVTAQGVEYSLPPAAVPQLQAGANQGAAATRTMRAWATHKAGPQEGPARPTLAKRGYGAQDFPPVEVLTGDEAHIVRLLEERSS